MTQQIISIEEPVQLYSVFSETPLGYTDMREYYESFSSLTLSSVSKLNLPAIVHRQLLYINMITVEEAEDYLTYLRTIKSSFDDSLSMFKLFYMIIYMLLYLKLYDSEYFSLYNKLYALALSFFNYDHFRERSL